ncbi:MAG: NAD-dependent epimerase/dehydratase family protein [Phycisphaerae bacterium]
MINLKDRIDSHHSPAKADCETALLQKNHPVSTREQFILITGGCGFFGANLADRLLRMRQNVLVFDNLSRPASASNGRRLKKLHGERVHIRVEDIRDRTALRQAVRSARQVFHLAGQSSVTASLTNIRSDFENNVVGTLNLLEELYALTNPPPLVVASSSNVYAPLEDGDLTVNGNRYEPVDTSPCHRGVSENHPLNFHTPFGCSKGSADQYVMDFARTFGLRNVVLRLSDVYGPHQLEMDDLGWVAHFLISTIEDQPIVVYGDGRQVRDILFIDDLVDALLLAQSNIEQLAGQAVNIGGGPDNSISQLEMIELIEQLAGKKSLVCYDQNRLGDQRYYVSDNGKFGSATGWRPKVDVHQGVERLYRWLTGTRKPLVSFYRLIKRKSENRCQVVL